MRGHFVRSQRAIIQRNLIHSAFESKQSIAATAEEEFIAVSGVRGFEFAVDFRFGIAVQINRDMFFIPRENDVMPRASFQDGSPRQSLVALIAVRHVDRSAALTVVSPLASP